MRPITLLFAPLCLTALLLCSCNTLAPVDDDSSPEGVDSDGDGVPDMEDPCPDDPAQFTDADGDGHCDELDDACLDDATGWTDVDGDGHCDQWGDACPNDVNQWSDQDNDGVCDEVDDACPGDTTGWTDGDGDGVCDEFGDACPNDPTAWVDDDLDGHCEPGDDEFPGNSDCWVDTNQNGLCDDGDDQDGDGITDGEEQIYGVDCAISDFHWADTDNDGVDDNQDPYPRDPYPEYMLFQNDQGTIDLMLSNRDGSFQAPVPVGDPYGGTGITSYRYRSFVISDFDNDGKTDFLAIGDADPADPNNARDLWWFWRFGDATTFAQRLVDGALDRGIFGTTADINNDEAVDLVSMERNPPSGFFQNAWLYSYLSQGNIETATCAYTTDPLNPNGCAFVRALAVDLTTWASGQWIVRHSIGAVDVDGDGVRDLVTYRTSSGGNTSVPVALLRGNGDGSFQAPGAPMFLHNSGPCGGSPANFILFADFNNDGLGDVLMGLDDDGDAGSAWFYPGAIGPNGYFIQTAGCFEAFDLNPAAESGGEHAGVTGAVRNFDVDFDGTQDIILGWNYTAPWTPPTETLFLGGSGTGSFSSGATIRTFTGTEGVRFAIPQRLCERFPIAP